MLQTIFTVRDLQLLCYLRLCRPWWISASAAVTTNSSVTDISSSEHEPTNCTQVNSRNQVSQEHTIWETSFAKKSKIDSAVQYVVPLTCIKIKQTFLIGFDRVYLSNLNFTPNYFQTSSTDVGTKSGHSSASPGISSQSSL